MKKIFLLSIILFCTLSFASADTSRFFKGKKLKCQQIKGAIYCNISLLKINNVAVEAITAARSISNFKILIFIAENYIRINHLNLKA